MSVQASFPGCVRRTNNIINYALAGSFLLHLEKKWCQAGLLPFSFSQWVG